MKYEFILTQLTNLVSCVLCTSIGVINEQLVTRKFRVLFLLIIYIFLTIVGPVKTRCKGKDNIRKIF